MTGKSFDEMTVDELCRLAHEEQVQIEVRIEPDGYGRTDITFTVQPWEKYEPFCPHGTPIVYVKGKEGEQNERD